MSDETIRDLIDRALDAYARLEERGEEVEDEWSYVADLSDAWRTRFDAVAAHRGSAEATDEAGAAVDLAIDEIGRIEVRIADVDRSATPPRG